MKPANDIQEPPALPSDEEVMNAFGRGLRAAASRHKEADVPMAVFRYGKIVEIPAADIIIPPNSDAKRG